MTTIGQDCVSCIGQADDSALISNEATQLQHLLSLTLSYCAEYNVQLSTEKTKLLVYSPSSAKSYVDYCKLISPISIHGTPVEFSESTEHVGIIRSPSGNLPHILQRITKHQKALASVLFAGLGRNHRGNPAASLRVESIYALPVLLSGVAALILLKSELDTLAQHYKTTIQNLQKLHPKTPRSVIFFLAGTLPAEAVLHCKQLSLFLMICQEPDNILHSIASHCLTRLPSNAKSWFTSLVSLTLQYSLPHPLALLNSPPTKQQFKRKVKQNVTFFWQNILRAETGTCKNKSAETSSLSSLHFFRPDFMSLATPHPLWTTCSSNSYEVNKAVVQARMLSGRYRTEKLCRHFSPNSTGHCRLCSNSLSPNPKMEDLQHLLLLCPALEERREALSLYWASRLSNNDVCRSIVTSYTKERDLGFVQLLLDCSTIPEVISAYQSHGPQVHDVLFQLTRTWCYSLHRQRLKLLGRSKPLLRNHYRLFRH